MIEDFAGLNFLKVLNLSANEIRLIPDLSSLKSLKKLNLSSNKIVSMVNLKYLSQAGVELESLDLSDNKLGNLKELTLLGSIKTLTEVFFDKSLEETNPFCNDLTVYKSEISVLNLPLNFKIDGHLVVDFLKTAQKELFSNKPQNSDPRLEYSQQSGFVSQGPKMDQNIDYIPQLENGPKVGKELQTKKSFSENIEEIFAQNEENQENSGPLKTDSKQYLFSKQSAMQNLNKKTTDTKINPFNLEKKVVELNDLLLFKEQNYKKREMDLNNSISNQKKTTDELNVKNGMMVQRIEFLEREKQALEVLLQESQKRSFNDQNLLDKFQKSQNESFKLRTKVDQLISNNGRISADLKLANDKMDKSEFLNQTLKIQMENLKSENSESRTKFQNTESEHLEKYKKLEFKFEELQTKSTQLSLENLNLKGTESNIKNTANITWEFEKLELKKQHTQEISQHSEKLKNLENNFEKEKMNIELYFHENLNKMESEFKALIIELSEKNSELRKENFVLKNQNVN